MEELWKAHKRMLQGDIPEKEGSCTASPEHSFPVMALDWARGAYPDS